MAKIPRKALIITLTTLALGLMVTGCATGSSSAATVGQPAPDFTLPNLDGESVSLSDFEGHPVLINFWRINCTYCLEEMPDLQAVFEERQGELVMLGINVGDNASSIEQFLQNEGLSFPALLDSDITVTRIYGISGTPTTFFIDKEGIIRAKVIGPFPNKAAIESRLSEIMP
jgi:cytochrome c biogenesis protein CcmG/thiol:disulfide interchange protein DsbE